jgi:hypothetical protein
MKDPELAWNALCDAISRLERCDSALSQMHQKMVELTELAHEIQKERDAAFRGVTRALRVLGVEREREQQLLGAKGPHK